MQSESCAVGVRTQFDWLRCHLLLRCAAGALCVSRLPHCLSAVAHILPYPHMLVSVWNAASSVQILYLLIFLFFFRSGLYVLCEKLFDPFR